MGAPERQGGEGDAADYDAGCAQCAEHLAEIARQGREITRLSARPSQASAEMQAFLDGWFAHARNPERLVVEEAWHARRARVTPPEATEDDQP